VPGLGERLSLESTYGPVKVKPGSGALNQIEVYIPEGDIADSGADGSTKVLYRLYAAGTGNTRFLKVTKA